MASKQGSSIRKGEWLELRTPDIAEEMLFRWLAEQFSFPEKYWRKLQAAGDVRVHRRRLLLRLFASETDRSVEGERMEGGRVSSNSAVHPESQPPDVVFEDDFVLVINKPAGVKVHPTQDSDAGTLTQQITAYYEQTGQRLRARVVHRLDQSTSGLIVFAKGEFAQLRLDEAMREKRIERVYYALVHGKPAPSHGTIDQPLGRDRHSDRYRVHQRGGKPAVTHYRVLEVFAGRGRDPFSLLELTLETGRTHQIRVHLAHLGHPLLGDVLYGGRAELMARPALHAGRLTFPHPWLGEPVVCEQEMPGDMNI